MQDEEYRPIKRSDIRLLVSLWPMTKAFRPLLAVGILMIVLASLVSVVFPYLTKVAIDSYILPLGRVIGDPSSIPSDLRNRLKDEDFIFSGQEGVYFIEANKAELIDSRQEKALIALGLLEPDRYYLRKIEGSFTQEEAFLLASESSGLISLYPYYISVKEKDLTLFPDAFSVILRSSDLSGLKTLAILFAVLMIISYFFDLGQRVILETASQKLGYHLRQRLLDHLFGLSQSFFDCQEAGRLTSRLTSDINNINNLIKSTAASFFSDLLSLFVVIVIMFALSPMLAFIALLITPLVILASLYFSKIARGLQRNLRGKISAINQNFAETRAGMSIIQAFRQEEYASGTFEALNHDNYMVGLRQVHSFAIFLPLVDLIASLVLGLILWFGGLMVFDNAVSLGVLAAFVGYANRFFAPVKDLAEKVNTFQSAFASMERINAIFDETDRTVPHGTPLVPISGGGEIEFKNISFKYGPDLPLVLDDISFTFMPGQSIAIVGETGSGKSSIINLMLRFYDPDEGAIYFDGQNLNQLDLSLHRKRIGLVTQDVYLYSGTVMDNLKLGREDVSDSVARQAAVQVGANLFIERLPHGYDERLGSEGKSLSAGQRQLLACARALINAPQIVILDEATAFVDSESELLISQAMHTIFEGRTSIVIAHRLSTIRNCDRILVLNHGKIVEQGAHTELLKLQGLYYHLACLQSIEGVS